MKMNLKWMGSLIVAMSCVGGSQTFGAEATEPVFRPPLIKQASAQSTVPAAKPATTPIANPPQQVPTSRWETQEPIETPDRPATAPIAGAGGGYATGCATYGDCGDCCDPGLQWIAGVEATFFFPQFSRTFLNSTVANGLGTTSIDNTAALGSADGSLLVGPRLTLGVQGETWGLVGRYWNSANSGTAFNPAFPGAIQSGITLFDTFNLYTADLELQRRFCWKNWDMFGFGGVRYASVNNDRNLWVQNTFGGDYVETSTFAAQQYNGTGVTFGVFGLRPLFCDDGALKAYFTNRYSILWGNGLAATQTNAQANTGGVGGISTDGAMAKSDGDLFIAEIGAGLQWEACLCCLPGRAFFRTGIEWQYWDSNAGVAAASNSFASSSTATAASSTSAGDLLFDLVGFTIGAGITY